MQKVKYLILITILILATGLLIGMSAGGPGSAEPALQPTAVSVPAELLTMRDVKQKKALFLETILPVVNNTNLKVELKRERLQDIKGSWLITPKERAFVHQLAAEYRVDGDDLDVVMDELLLRVDGLPPSLMLAQAAIESGWGTSRFATKGNNLFGLRSTSGQGMVPSERAKGQIFKVSEFDDLQACMDYYLWTINTHSHYAELRDMRSQKPDDAEVLAQGLIYYSEQAERYVEKVIAVLRYNELQRFDFQG